METILELGLGNGRSVISGSAITSRYVVVEGSLKVIEQFMETYPNNKVHCVHSYFETFDTDQKFDIIIMGFVLEHVDDPLNILRKYKDFLKPGGTIYITVPNWEALNKKIGYHAGMIDNMHVFAQRDRDLGHQRTFSVDSLRQLVLDAGLRSDVIEGLLLKPIATSQMQKLGFTDNIYKALIHLGKDYPELSSGILVKAHIGGL